MLQQKLKTLLEGGTRLVVVDGSKVGQIGSGAMRVLLLVARAARADAPTDAADPDQALRLSVLGSAFPLAAIGLGTLVSLEGTQAPIRDVGAVFAVGGALVGIVTPALGDFYAHRWFSPGIALRAGGRRAIYLPSPSNDRTFYILKQPGSGRRCLRW